MKHYNYIIYLLLPIFIVGCSSQKKTTPSRSEIIDAVFASGTLIMKDHYQISSQSEGYLAKSFVLEGDSVKTGQVLFHIMDESPNADFENAQAAYTYAVKNSLPNSDILQRLQSQLLQTRNRLAVDSVNYIRYKNLLRTNAVAQADYDKAKLAFDNSREDLSVLEHTISDTKLSLANEVSRTYANLITQKNSREFCALTGKSPGIVLQRMKNDGDLVRRGDAVAEIGSGPVVAQLSISEEDIARITNGQIAFIELNSEPGKSYEAQITRVYPAFDAKQQAFIVEAQFIKQPRFLKSGTQLQANIVVQKHSSALVIPAAYLTDKNMVQIAATNEFRPVQTGIRTGEWAEILSGLDEKTVIKLPEAIKAK